MAQSLVGSVHEFNPQEEEWKHYVEQLNQYFDANGIDDAAKRRAILLSCVGSKTYKLISDLVSPDGPATKTFDQLTQLLTTHFTPHEPVIMSRFNFNRRNRHESESVSDYVRELRRLAKECQYGNQLNMMLRDRLVVGVNQDAIQRKLLSEPDDLAFDRALTLALSIEQASAQVQKMKQSEPVQSVHRVGAKSTQLSSGGEKKKTHGCQNRGAMNRRKQPVAQSERTTAERGTCFCCGLQGHRKADCQFKDAVCYRCKKVGHLKSVCRSAARGKTNLVEEVEEYTEYTFTIAEHGTHRKPVTVPLTLNGKEVHFELDTGASRTLISEKLYNQQFKNRKGCVLKDTNTKLLSYTGEEIPVLGEWDCIIQYEDQRYELPLLVVKGTGRALLGRNWLTHIRLEWENIFVVKEFQLEKEFGGLFEEKLGRFEGPPVKIHLKQEVQPIFWKARSVPYALKAGIEKYLDQAVKDGVLEQVDHSDWACPVVPVVKPDQSIRLCGDYKLTVNRAVKVDRYPLPTIADLYAKLSGGIVFTKLDLSQAYHQIVVEENSREALTINTHKGLFRPTRLPFGLSSSPGIFQRVMDGLLAGLPGVCVYIDDIIVTGTTVEEHRANVKRVLQKLESAGLKLKRNKCAFGVSSVSYLGHRIDAQGLHMQSDKVEAVRGFPEPKNVSELRTFLGMLNHYRTFLPRAAEELQPLYQLLRKDVVWKWGAAQEKSFSKAKELLSSAKVLVHYDPKRPLILECDASARGVGAVLSHVTEEGERPVAFASRSLNEAEVRYSQIEREALAIIFGVKRFHKMLYGREFTLRSDHKPLLFIFNENKAIPTMASARIQRWALLLSAYKYKMEYMKGSEIVSADALSRLPLPVRPARVPVPAEVVNLVKTLDDGPVTSVDISRETCRDPVLSKLRGWIQGGWPPESPGPEWSPYFRRAQELSTHQGCVLWGNRVVIPPKLRREILDTLHEAHPGMSRMKSLARQYLWWPKLDAEVEKLCGACEECLQQRPNRRVEMRPWPFPGGPWQRLHMDHAGPFRGRLYFVVVDAYSKWLEVIPVASTSSEATIKALEALFITHGLPRVLVSDNATGFTSQEFKQYLRSKGIRHRTAPPYHPSSNGQVERAVQTFKKALLKASRTESDIALQKFLFRYRVTPHAATDVSPAELLMGRKLRTTLDALVPDLTSKVEADQESWRGERREDEVPLEEVWVRDFSATTDQRWMPGRVSAQESGVLVDVDTDDGSVRRHLDQVRPRSPGKPAEIPLSPRDITPVKMPVSQGTTVSPSVEPLVPLRRSKRLIVPPKRLDL